MTDSCVCVNCTLPVGGLVHGASPFTFVGNKVNSCAGTSVESFVYFNLIPHALYLWDWSARISQFILYLYIDQGSSGPLQDAIDVVGGPIDFDGGSKARRV